jgi:hypothetical protein
VFVAAVMFLPSRCIAVIGGYILMGGIYEAHH